MATARIYLRTDQPLATGEFPIMMRLIKDRKKREMVLKYKCHPSLWDDKINKPKRKHPMYHELTMYLTEKEREVNKIILALNGENKPFTVEDIFNKLSLSIKVNQTTVF
ncbi:MAG: Arm DNA-binding domain-containing protein, partial [Bacteroidota bacterium]